MSQFKRNCPKCGIEKEYASKQTYLSACKVNAKCRKCVATETGFIDRYASENNSGSANPFFGKKHTDETKSILSSVDKSKYKTDEFKEKMKSVVSRGQNHHMYNSSHFDFWVNLYGSESAEELESSRRKKISEKNIGSNNPMYGKPSPQGSGNGWKGWYNDWFFRSLRELSYMVDVIEKNEWEWISAEKEEFAIQYCDWENKTRNYFADFLVNHSVLIEIKPLKLHDSANVLAKATAAKKFCKEKGWIYEIVDPIMLSDDEIMRLYDKGRIKFTDKYERKYNERIGKKTGDDAWFTMGR